MKTAFLSALKTLHPALLWVCCLGLWAATENRGLAAPSNNDFASATALPASLPFVIQTSNVGATLEVGEPQPETVGATVWWTWTSSTNGWVRVTTQGTDIDTVLAVYSGSSLSGLKRLAFNDDAGDTDVLSGASELILQVKAGTTYRFQVGGYDGWEGSFKIEAKAIPAPPTLTALSLTPPTVEVTSQLATTTAELQIVHPGRFSRGILSVFRPDGVLEAELLVSVGTLIAGTATNGTHRVVVPIRKGVVPGAYTVQLDLYGVDGRRAVYGERTAFPEGFPESITVVNKGEADDQAPKPTQFTITPANIDVTTSSKTVTLTTRIEDPLSGIVDFTCKMEIWRPNGLVERTETFSRRNRTGGNSFDGTYTVQFTIPAGSEPGDYSVHFNLVDLLDNRVVYGNALEQGETPMPDGLPTHYTVVNTGGTDKQPPVIGAATVSPSTINVAAFEPLKMRLTALDTKSGVADIEFAGLKYGLRKVTGGPVVDAYIHFSLTSGTPNNGVWEGSTVLPESLAPGEYLVVGIQMTDLLGNVASYGPADLGLVPYPAGIRPVVTIVSSPPETPYQKWLKGYPGLKGNNAAPNADPDGDRLENLLELALGTDPLVATVVGGADPKVENAPKVYRKGTRLYMDYTLVRENLGTGPKAIEVFPEESTNLLSWDGAQQLILGDGKSSIFISTSAPYKFLRLRVTDPSPYVAQ